MSLTGYCDPRIACIEKFDARRGTAQVLCDDGQHLRIPFEILQHSSELAVGQRVKLRFDADKTVCAVELENLPPAKVRHVQLDRASATGRGYESRPRSQSAKL